MRGKLDLPQTIKVRIQHKPQATCTFDELSEDNLYNQILKTTLQVLLRDENVSTERKVELKKALLFLDTVSALLPSQIPWRQLHYQRSNQNYEMLLNLCYFVLHDMLQTTESGSYKMTAFSDEHMAKLYERFILEYYRQHHPYLTEVGFFSVLLATEKMLLSKMVTGMCSSSALDSIFWRLISL